jgi:small subunit ribosomal protein S9
VTTAENEEGQPVTTPEPGTEAAETAAAEIEAVEEAALDADATDLADAADAADATDLADAADEYAAETEAVPAIPAVFSDRPIQTVGRRKEAVVRVRLMPGSGAFRLNGKSLEEYFPNKLHQQLIREPLVTVEKTERFDIFANLHGGGTSGQAGALRLAIARALIEADPEDRPPLKKAGFLTRDPRVIERKKYGLKKARKAPQYSKR